MFTGFLGGEANELPPKRHKYIGHLYTVISYYLLNTWCYWRKNMGHLYTVISYCLLNTWCYCKFYVIVNSAHNRLLTYSVNTLILWMSSITSWCVLRISVSFENYHWSNCCYSYTALLFHLINIPFTDGFLAGVVSKSMLMPHIHRYFHWWKRYKTFVSFLFFHVIIWANWNLAMSQDFFNL